MSRCYFRSSTRLDLIPAAPLPPPMGPPVRSIGPDHAHWAQWHSSSRGTRGGGRLHAVLYANGCLCAAYARWLGWLPNGCSRHSQPSLCSPSMLAPSPLHLGCFLAHRSCQTASPPARQTRPFCSLHLLSNKKRQYGRHGRSLIKGNERDLH